MSPRGRDETAGHFEFSETVTGDGGDSSGGGVVVVAVMVVTAMAMV